MFDFVFLAAFLVNFIGTCHGFATIDEFAKVLDIFKDTKFHDTQLLSALCITQYEFLKRNKGFQGRKPDFYDECPYEEWQTSASKDLFDVDELDSIKGEFERAVAAPDLRSMKPFEHFDLESFIKETNVKLLKSRRNLLKQMKTSDPSFSDIRGDLGEMLHTVQDFYSHTNWVELGKEKINPMVGRSSSLGISINDNSSVACKPCDQSSFTEKEKAEIEDAYSGLLTSIPLKILGNRDNIFSCRGNMVTNSLTSGYYSGEKKYGEWSQGKCAHGGFLDDFAQKESIGGINKDAATIIMSPHYYLHHLAANLSVKATIKYFDDLRTSLGDERIFGKLIGIDFQNSKTSNSIAFLIDTTGSMRNSIETVKQFSEKLITESGNETSDYFLIPFNDPQYGPVKEFRNPQQIIQEIKMLQAEGGGARSEKLFAALLDTVTQLPHDTSIFVFTDSSSKNCGIASKIIKIAAKKNLQINIFMSGIVSARKRRAAAADSRDGCDIHGSIENYRNLALATNGQFVVAYGNENVENLAKVVGDRSWETLKMFNNIVTPFNETIEFDKSVKEVEVVLDAVATANLNNLQVKITDENGTNISPGNTLIDNAFTKVFRFNTTDDQNPSPWNLIISGINQTIAQISIKVKSNVTTSIGITNSESQKSVKNSLKAGEAHDICFTCGSCSKLSSVTITKCDSSTPIMPPQTPEKSGKTNRWCVKNLKLPPTSGEDQFCIAYTGNLNDGTSFERIAQQKLSTNSLALNTTFSTDSNSTDPGDVFPNDLITINYLIENLGEQDDEVELKMKNSMNLPMTFFNETIKIPKGKMAKGNVYVNANAPAGSMVDVELEAVSVLDPSRHASAEFNVFVVDPDEDYDGPECNVDYSTVVSCPKERKHCDTAEYVVLLSYSDDGSGVSRIEYEEGKWNMTDMNYFNTQFASNHTFYAMGVLSCCNDTQFTIYDKENNIGQCNLDANYKTAAMIKASSSSSMIKINSIFVTIIICFGVTVFKGILL